MKLAFCHASSLPEGTFVKYHTHDVLEIVYYTHGEGEIFLDGARSEIRPGVFHVAPAGMKHEQKNRSPLRAICIGVGQSGLEDLAGAYQDLHGIVRYHAERLIAELLAKSGAWEIVALGIVYEISGLVRRIIQQPENVAPDDVVERALQLIREREGRVSVEELSTALYLEKDYLRHLFKRRTNQSPMQRIIETRLGHARTLLTTTALSADEIAARTGFTDGFYLSKVFKKYTGETLRSCRAALTKGNGAAPPAR